MSDITTLMMAASGAGGAEETDPNFNQTVLLLHGDGTNGAQNNTFLDSSTNNFTITRNGNTTQGSFSPFSNADGEWSNYFDGSGDYLTSSQVIDTSDFSIEALVYFTDPTYAKYAYIFAQGSAGTSGRLGLYIEQTTGYLVLQISSTLLKGTSQIPTNTWVYVAARRSSNATAIYVDAVSENTGTQSDAIQATTAYIGRSWNSGDEFTGYISNLRVSDNATTITVPTTSYTSDANTELLTCQSNRFKDNSTNAFAFTVNGTPSVQPFSPFAPSAAYSPSVNGGSGYFDGTGDYLTCNQVITTANFSIEAWVYPTSFADYRTIFAQGTAGTAGRTAFYTYTGTGVLAFQITTSYVYGSTPLKLNAWNHVAVTRSSGTVTLYLNGVSDGTGTIATTVQSTGAIIGAVWGFGDLFLGYMSGLRVSDTARTISLPSAPYTSDANTSLLLSATNAGILDNTGKNNLETVGNAQVDTATKKYGTGSMEFDGTGDWLLMPHNPDQQLGTGDFTIEFWVYLATGDAGSNRGLVAKGTSTTGFLVSLNTTEKVVFTFTTSTITSTGAITLDAWNHIAVVREGTGSNETKIYIGGTNDGTGTVSTDFNQTSVMYVGANRTGGDPMKGFIDDLRITKGVARYTANFTPPTKAFPDL